ncbi:MAG: ethanolamine ammonia-lyase subunit EutB, partial [Algiphilus sp.]|nr:ethanolamine ammonia-lyase subunit EutB [Algiphilus sp.]
TLMTVLGVAGVNFIMGVPGSDDVMLGYQSTSFHDALYLRRVLGKAMAPEFADWLRTMGIYDAETGLPLNPPAAKALMDFSEAAL